MSDIKKCQAELRILMATEIFIGILLLMFGICSRWTVLNIDADSMITFSMFAIVMLTANTYRIYRMIVDGRCCPIPPDNQNKQNEPT